MDTELMPHISVPDHLAFLIVQFGKDEQLVLCLLTLLELALIQYEAWMWITALLFSGGVGEGAAHRAGSGFLSGGSRIQRWMEW